MTPLTCANSTARQTSTKARKHALALSAVVVLLEKRRQRATRQLLHREEWQATRVAAELVDGRDCGVLEPTLDARFTQEPLDRNIAWLAATDPFDRDVAAELLVARDHDFSHAASADPLSEAIAITHEPLTGAALRGGWFLVRRRFGVTVVGLHDPTRIRQRSGTSWRRLPGLTSMTAPNPPPQRTIAAR